MKKKILGGMAVFIATIAAINVNFNTTNNKMPAISLSNVEALASGEDSDCADYCKPNGHGCYCDLWWPAYRE